QNSWPADVVLIESWLLLEYACCWLPGNQEAIVEEVSKSLPLPSMLPDQWRQKQSTPIAQKSAGHMAFTPEEEIIRALQRRLDNFDPTTFFHKALDRARGIV